MAKASFSKLQLTKNNEVKTFDFNGQTIEVKQYLPIEEKISMFETILSSATRDTSAGYYNITEINFWIDLEIIFNYTNINFTDKQKEDMFKLYDMLKGSGLIDLVKNNMRGEELSEIINTVWNTAENIYKYASSALGVMQAISADYSNLNLEASDIQEKIADPNNLSLLKDVLTKLG